MIGAFPGTGALDLSIFCENAAMGKKQMIILNIFFIIG
jgi:hypothetical protein